MLISYHFFSYSCNSQYFMITEISFPILSQTNPIQLIPSFYFLNIHFNIKLPSTPRSSEWPFLSVIPIKTLCILSSYVLCAPSIQLFLTWYLVSSRDKKNSSLYRVLHSPFTSSLSVPNSLLSILFSNTLILFSYLNELLSFAPIQNNRQNYSTVYFNLYIFGQKTGRHNILDGKVAGRLEIS